MLVALTWCFTANAQEKLVNPDTTLYNKEDYPFIFNMYHDDKDPKNDTIVYGFESKKYKTLWIGICNTTQIKGLNTIRCNIHSEPTNFGVVVTNNTNDLFFDYENTVGKKIWKNEVNYRLNGEEIITIPVNFIPDNFKAKFIINDIAAHSKLEYSIKDSKNYRTFTYNLLGLRQAIDFAEKIIRLNQ